ncbi:transcription-repair coupling factor [Halobacteriovorax sp. GB3]|uniref:transcription-repair coupling factor n=1 Tax=Halobacteriovorax sp. GB3 TaxID=2719615 RepID=UPI00236178B0|nr:transcription-repair coupling factor [Halobacteriovorax sp. GB3]MDD0854707.1 transcription-repair coupling factor [Halobacteriovorax sp. GB3]
MTYLKGFNSLFQRLEQWKQGNNKGLKVSGINPEQFLLLLGSKEGVNFADSRFVFVFATQDEADKFSDNHKSLNKKLFSYPGLEVSPYQGIYASERNQFSRFSTLANLTNKNFQNIVLTPEALLLKTAPLHFFKDNFLKIEVEDIISPDELALKLVELGYSSSTTVEEEGTFSKKGEIFDIFPVGARPIRLNYFDELIEKIYAIDLETQKTIRDQELESVTIVPTPYIFSNREFSNALRENIPMPAPGERGKFEKRKHIFSSLSDNLLFDNHVSYTPLFFKESSTIRDYLSDDYIFIYFDSHLIEDHALELLEDLRVDYNRESEDERSELLLPEPQSLYSHNLHEATSGFKTLTINHIDIEKNLDEDFSNVVSFNLKDSSIYFKDKVNSTLSKPEYIKSVFNTIKHDFEKNGEILISTQTENSRREIQHIFDILDFPKEILSRVIFKTYSLSKGFFYEAEKVLVLSEADFFSAKRKTTKTHYKKNVDLFAEQLASLKEGDFVVHTEYGIGEYLGLESLNIGGNQTDYLVLLYKGNDKVYVPVYKMNLVQKHAESGSKVGLDSIRTNKFSNLKNKAKNSVKELAFDLLKLQAERQSSPGYSFTEPDHDYKEFELAFPFVETPDQRRAIDEVLQAMHKPSPMDYLVCGDVGFGKTEIAMRAAFKAILDKKQVAVLVPTTVLAFQHYNSFVKRFKDFPVNIEFLSRFKTGKEEKEIKENLELGKVDIIIGTHKLLSKTVRYFDLGLVVVDEEQRFGVAHKEKLKLLKNSVDFLTLTATPIPRTLQLAFLGIRDLSLIQTPPPRRQSIKSYIIKQDDHTLQTAIRKELGRGGQVFVVHNKVQDIEAYTSYIQELVPEANVIYAHGQLSEKELETRMKSFYEGRYQILIATTIIESGIDIPNANTMIVDRADTYGLSQLHQLRGRIGRSDKKAYCYFIIPKHKIITEVASKRLRALQTYADMGSGFHIANCDLEIRGAGDILGGTQSGHIENIGLELYMQLLKEAIQELRGEKKILKKDIEISTPFASYIPNHFITDSSERLKQYKKLSNCNSLDEIEDIASELEDVYGLIPEELQNLIMILKTRVTLQSFGLKSIQVAGTLISLQFDKQILELNEQLRNSIVETFISRPKTYQFTPDFKVIYTHKTGVNQADLLSFAEDIAKQIVPC